MENINPLFGCNSRTTSLNTLYTNPGFSEYGKPCDALLKTDDGLEFKIYTKFLSVQSEYFNTLFLMKEETGQTTVIHGIESDTFETILLHLYTGGLSLTTNNMMHLLVASDFLMIAPLMSESRRFVLKNVTVENCLLLYITAYRIKRLDMEEKCRRVLFISFEKAVTSSWEEAFELPFLCLRYFLSNPSVNVSGERFVWLFIETWVLKDPSNRMPFVPELLRLLSMNEIDEDLAGDIISSPIILENELYKGLGNLHETLPYLTSDVSKAQTIIIFHNDVPYITGARLPQQLHFVTKSLSQANGGEMFLTYDDRLDVLRNVGVVNFRPLKLLRVLHHVYIFEGHSLFRGVRCGSVYDLLDGSVQTMSLLQNGIFDVSFVVQVASEVYALKNDVLEEEVCFYQYDLENNEWIQMTRMYHHREMIVEEAVGLNGLLYAVCQRFDDTMLMQVYDPSSFTWVRVSPPRVLRRRMAAVVFEGKIFLFGGEYDDMDNELRTSKDVEVYDPAVDQWLFYPELLFAYENVRTSVIGGKLYVYDTHVPPVTCWDGRGEWKIVNDLSPSLQAHCFCTIDTEFVVRELVRKNREADVADWLESGGENHIFSRSSL